MPDFPEYQCPVCGDQMEHERSWGCYGKNTREEHKCPACEATLTINCENRKRLEAT